MSSYWGSQSRYRRHRDARLGLLDEAVRGRSVAYVARAFDLYSLPADGPAVVRGRGAAAARAQRASSIRLLSLGRGRSLVAGLRRHVRCDNAGGHLRERKPDRLFGVALLYIFRDCRAASFDGGSV